MPALYVTAFRVGSQDYRYVITNPGQTQYQVDGLAPGAYHVVAHTIGGGGFPAGVAGGLTAAEACGLGASCTDGILIDVNVIAR
jgi:hypothetical protein